MEESGGHLETTCEELGIKMVSINDTQICDHIMMGWTQGVMMSQFSQPRMDLQEYLL